MLVREIEVKEDLFGLSEFHVWRLLLALLECCKKHNNNNINVQVMRKRIKNRSFIAYK
jgi:hypothetical protein